MNAIFTKRCFQFIIQLTLIDIQLHAVHGDHCIRQYQREEFHIISTNIQCPADVIQCSKHMFVCMILLHLFTDSCKFALCGLTCIFNAKCKYRLPGKLRSVCPDLIDEILMILDLATLICSDLLILISCIHGNNSSIYSQCTA